MNLKQNCYEITDQCGGKVEHPWMKMGAWVTSDKWISKTAGSSGSDEYRRLRRLYNWWRTSSHEYAHLYQYWSIWRSVNIKWMYEGGWELFQCMVSSELMIYRENYNFRKCVLNKLDIYDDGQGYRLPAKDTVRSPIRAIQYLNGTKCKTVFETYASPYLSAASGDYTIWYNGSFTDSMTFPYYGGMLWHVFWLYRSNGT